MEYNTNKIITDDGKNLVAQSLQEGKKVNFDSFIVTNTPLPNDRQLSAMVIDNFKNIRKYPITNLKKGKNSVQPEARFDNNGLTEDYSIVAIGLLASISESNTVLFGITQNAEGTPAMLPKQSSTPYLTTYDMGITVNNPDNYQATITPAGYVDQNTFDNTINEIHTDIQNIDLSPYAKQEDLTKMQQTINDNINGPNSTVSQNISAAEQRANTRTNEIKAQLDADIDEKASKNDLNNLSDSSLKWKGLLPVGTDTKSIRETGIYIMDGNPNQWGNTPDAQLINNSWYNLLIVIGNTSWSSFFSVEQKIITSSGITVKRNIGVNADTGWHQMATNDYVDYQINNLSNDFGGRNYALSIGNTTNNNNQSYDFNGNSTWIAIGKSGQNLSNKTVTLSFYYSNANNLNGGINVYLTNSGGAGAQASFNFKLENGNGRYTHTFKVPNVTGVDTGSNLFIWTSGSAEISYPKLEIGKVATDWNPAIENMATKEDVYQYNLSIDNGKLMYGDKPLVTAIKPIGVTLYANPSGKNINYQVTVDYDGGSPITNYQIFYKKQSDDTWQIVNNNHSSGTINVDYGAYDLKAEASNEVGATSSDNVSIQLQDERIYGASWSHSTNPTLTRTDSAVGMIAGINGDRNDFDNTNIWGAMHRVKDNYGNIFIRIPKLYIRKANITGTSIWQVSLVKHGDDWYLPKCFWDFNNNKELPYVDVGAYFANLNGNFDTSNGVLESKTNTVPITTAPIGKFRNYARNNGKGYQILDIHVWDMLQVLFTIEFATLNSQSVMYGHAVNYNSAYTDHMKGSSAGDYYNIKYRGIESLYCNLQQVVDGINSDNMMIFICDNADDYSDNQTAYPYHIISYSITTESGKISIMGLDPNNPEVSLPIRTDSYDYYYSYFYYGSGICNLNVGSSNGYNSNGIWCSNFALNLNKGNTNVTTRLVRKAVQ